MLFEIMVYVGHTYLSSVECDAAGIDYFSTPYDFEAVEMLRPFVDVFKIGHHGSIHSNGTTVYETITADHYVFSASGEHGNPHPDTLTALFETQVGRPISVYLTNHPEAGAVKPTDAIKAREAQRILDVASKNPNVTVQYRADSDRAVVIAP